MNIADLDYRSLPVAQRLQLVGDIRDSIATEAPDALEPSTADKAEWHRRLAAHEADPGNAVPWPTSPSEGNTP
ncbi:MAG: addiction module protein [Pseudomonadota bacterium]|nr:addiction module protein [Pseudomonadota bacterium]